MYIYIFICIYIYIYIYIYDPNNGPTPHPYPFKTVPYPLNVSRMPVPWRSRRMEPRPSSRSGAAMVPAVGSCWFMAARGWNAWDFQSKNPGCAKKHWRILECFTMTELLLFEKLCYYNGDRYMRHWHMYHRKSYMIYALGGFHPLGGSNWCLKLKKREGWWGWMGKAHNTLCVM